MKIIHTADWHLGNTFHSHARHDEHAHFLGWLLDCLAAELPDALVVSGDVFDTANPPAAAERQFYDFLVEATERVPGMQVVVTAGNHDSAGRLEAAARLLKRHNVYVRGLVRRDEETGEPLFGHYLLPLSLRTDSEARAVCLALPYLRPADYPAGLSQGEGLAWWLERLTRELRRTPFRGLPLVVSAHFYAAGARLAEGEHSERLVAGGQDAVEARLAECGAAYYALGHLHRAQRVDGVRGEMYYAGSALPMSFAERHYDHGALRVELDEGGAATVQRLRYEPLRGLTAIPAKGAAEAGEVLEAIARLPRRRDGRVSAAAPYLELRVTERQPQPSLLHEVAQALDDRDARFCRMVREVPAPAAAGPSGVASLEALRHLSAEDMAGRVFASRYGGAMPEEMLVRLRRAEREAEADDGKESAAEADAR